MKLASPMNREIKNQLKDIYFVGKLATSDDLATTLIGMEPVKFDEYNGEVLFYIKCLSEIPEKISSHFEYPNKIIVGGTKSNNNTRKFNDWFNYDRIPHFEKREKVESFLEGKLIIFTLADKGNFVNVEIHKVEEVDTISSHYEPIPGPELKTGESRDDFEEKIATSNRPIVLPKYPNLFEIPLNLVLEGRFYDVYLKPGPNPTTYSPNIDDSTAIKFIDIDEKIADYVSTRIDDYLYFLSKENYKKLIAEIKDNGEYLLNEIENRREESEQSTIEDEVNRTKPEELEIKQYIDKGVTQPINKGEIEFIQLLRENARKRGLHYRDMDLISFHISAKTNLLTVLGGLSGTGKTQLALLYGETLGLQLGKDLNLIPISPSYTEPNDILGYLNPTTGVYHESDTGLVNLLLQAQKYDNRLHMVIFDEANLSQVEHWFSPFISLLELDEDNRRLTLFSEKSFCVNERYMPKVPIKNNILFVGTVNFDETTRDFSDRLLDRTNVITPSKLSFTESKEMAKLKKEDIDTISIGPESYRENWVNKDVGLNDFSDDELFILDEIHNCLNENDMQKGVSFRVALSIAMFLENIPVNEEGELMIRREEALDLQVKQRILTKVKGLESFVAPLVGTYLSDGTYEEGTLTKLLQSETAKKVSSFEHSIKMLKSKANELRFNGYAN